MRQRQNPFGGAVGPVTSGGLVFADEFEHGVDGAVPALLRQAGIANQLDITGYTFRDSFGTLFPAFGASLLDAWLQQAVWGVNPRDVAGDGFGWASAVRPLPVLAPLATAGPGSDAISTVLYTHIAHRYGEVPEAGDGFEVYGGAIIGFGLLPGSPSPGAPFVSIGIKLADQYFAQISKWGDEETLLDEQLVPLGAVGHSIALRLRHQVSVEDPFGLCTADYSLDGGMSFTGFNDSVPILGPMTCIGFGATGQTVLVPVPAAGEMGIDCRYLRLFQNLTQGQGSFVQSGGRNWPR